MLSVTDIGTFMIWFDLDLSGPSGCLVHSDLSSTVLDIEIGENQDVGCGNILLISLRNGMR